MLIKVHRDDNTKKSSYFGHLLPPIIYNIQDGLLKILLGSVGKKLIKLGLMVNNLVGMTIEHAMRQANLGEVSFQQMAKIAA